MRKHWLVRISIVLVAVIILILSLGYHKHIAVSGSLNAAKVIVIDPGHGGFDPGKKGTRGKDEKDINLAISIYLKEYLLQGGYEVIMTREEDVDLYEKDGSGRRAKTIDLTNRKKIATKNNPNAIVTVHVNSFPESKYYGAQTFYAKNNEKSQRLALIIQEELIRVLDKENKRTALEKDDVYMIKGLDIPAVLVECGFLSNPEEEQKLNDPKYQQKVAYSIYVGLDRYLKTYSQE